MNVSHVRIELVLSFKWAFLAAKTLTSSATGDHAPELFGWPVDCVVMTPQVVFPREGLFAIWLVTADLPQVSRLLAVAEEHVIILARAR